MLRLGRMRRAAILFILALVGAAGCGRSTRPPGDGGTVEEPPWGLRLETAGLAVAPASGQPQLTAGRGGVVASWIEVDGATAALRFAERTGDGWSEIRTAATGDDWFISWADVPAVLRLSTGTLVAQWLESVDPAIEAYDIRLAHSSDDGRTWSRPFAPHHDGTRTQHGFASLFEMPGQGLGLVWLDGRQMELDTTSRDGGAMSLRFAAFDRQWAQTADMEVNARVCECCPTSAAVTTDGIVTVFRDRSLREIRDIHASRFEGGAWSYPVPVHVDNWRIDACPVNGPSLSAAGRRAAVAWFTAVGDRPQAFVAFSDDAGRTWGQPVRLDDDSTLGHVDVELLDDGSAAAVWVEFSRQQQRSAVRLRRIDPSGTRSAAIDVPSDPMRRASGLPRLARAGRELVVAWTEGGGPSGDPDHVRIATGTIP